MKQSEQYFPYLFYSELVESCLKNPDELENRTRLCIGKYLFYESRGIPFDHGFFDVERREDDESSSTSLVSKKLHTVHPKTSTSDETLFQAYKETIEKKDFQIFDREFQELWSDTQFGSVSYSLKRMRYLTIIYLNLLAPKCKNDIGTAATKRLMDAAEIITRSDGWKDPDIFEVSLEVLHELHKMRRNLDVLEVVTKMTAQSDDNGLKMKVELWKAGQTLEDMLCQWKFDATDEESDPLFDRITSMMGLVLIRKDVLETLVSDNRKQYLKEAFEKVSTVLP